MSRRNFGILILIAAVFVILAVVGRQANDNGPIAGDLAGTLFLGDFTAELDSVDQVLIDGAGSQRLVSLERSESGWVVADLGGYPAERAEVNALLIALGEARVVEEKTANPGFYDRLGVEDISSPEAAGVHVTLVSGNGDRVGAIIGERYNNGQRYARIDGSDLSVLIDRDPAIATDPSDWVADEILSLETDRIQRVEIAHADGETLVIHKDMRGAADFTVDNIPVGRELQYSGIANVTGNLPGSLRLDRVEPQTAATEDPATVTEFRTFDGLVVTVTADTEADGEGAWLSFSARFDPDQAAAFAADDTDATAATEESADASAQPEAADVEAEADELNSRLSGWRYQIPSYQYSQLTRRMEDLLQPESDE